MRISLENGIKGKKFVCYAIDWPGLERNGKTPEAALEKVALYRDRYARVADRAGLASEFAAEPDVAIVEEYPGTPSTDFWGISFAQSPLDIEGFDSTVLERRLALLQACWSELDALAVRVSPELQKGPRGGGRDRDQIVRHVLANELEWVPNMSDRPELDEVFIPARRERFHAEVLDAIREYHAAGPPPIVRGRQKWTSSYLLRHMAYHVMDHAWEMEDKDLTGKEVES